jgi:hypothetical protein
MVGMRVIAGFSLLYCLLLFGGCQPSTINLYVSPDGNKGNNGQMESPVNDIQEAVKLAEFHKSKDPDVNININILPGDYRMTSPIQINTVLNGLSIIGTGASEVRIKGSVPLDLEWVNAGDKIYTASVRQDFTFDQLIVDDKLQTLARYPNYDEDGGDWQGHAADAVSKERLASWAKPGGAVLPCYA